MGQVPFLSYFLTWLSHVGQSSNEPLKLPLSQGDDRFPTGLLHKPQPKIANEKSPKITCFQPPVLNYIPTSLMIISQVVEHTISQPINHFLSTSISIFLLDAKPKKSTNDDRLNLSIVNKERLGFLTLCGQNPYTPRKHKPIIMANLRYAANNWILRWWS